MALTIESATEGYDSSIESVVRSTFNSLYLDEKSRRVADNARKHQEWLQQKQIQEHNMTSAMRDAATEYDVYTFKNGKKELNTKYWTKENGKPVPKDDAKELILQHLYDLWGDKAIDLPYLHMNGSEYNFLNERYYTANGVIKPEYAHLRKNGRSRTVKQQFSSAGRRIEGVPIVGELIPINASDVTPAARTAIESELGQSLEYYTIYKTSSGDYYIEN